MKVHVLASGSTGNAACIEMGDQAVLVDAGISARRIKAGLDSVGVAVENVAAVLVTHEHSDHVKGLATLTKKYRLPVYARSAVHSTLCARGLVAPQCCQELPEVFNLGSLQIESFSISHDAVDPVGFNFYDRQHKCSYVTDVGYVTDRVRNYMADADMVVFEANHDVDLLETGKYPWHLKRRILSTQGHLSNVDCGCNLSRLVKKQHTDVLLAHLSQENNRPDIAATTVGNILESNGYVLGKDITLHLTYPDQIVSRTKSF